jgi:hypothetical protein
MGIGQTSEIGELKAFKGQEGSEIIVTTPSQIYLTIMSYDSLS